MAERHTPLIKLNGVAVGRGRNIDFIEGANTDLTITYDELTHEIDVTVASTGGGGAPTDADYLVGTANGSLSNEIVAGTAPGGELGGTWGSPTVDATHSGSTHSAATDTHIADATDAHDASAISILDAAGDFTATEVEGALAELQSDAEAHTAAADPHTGYLLESLFDAKGDLISATADNTPVRVGIGADGTIPTADSGQAAGWSWQAPGAAAHPGFITHAKFGAG